ncbi:MAG: rhodanese-like domain-containing protein [Gemmatirosa sp.]
MTATRRLAGAAAVLGVSAAVVGSAEPAGRAGRLDVAALAREIDREADHVDAVELARWIRDRKAGLRVLDVRDDSAYAAYHIPGAERLALADVARMAPSADGTLVLYSEGGAHAAQAWVLLRASGHARVYFLRGGLLDWLEQVMNPVNVADPEVAALSRYFGGVPRAGAVPDPGGALAPASGAVARMRRRGC